MRNDFVVLDVQPQDVPPVVQMTPAEAATIIERLDGIDSKIAGISDKLAVIAETQLANAESLLGWSLLEKKSL